MNKSMGLDFLIEIRKKIAHHFCDVPQWWAVAASLGNGCLFINISTCCVPLSSIIHCSSVALRTLSFMLLSLSQSVAMLVEECFLDLKYDS